MKLAMIGAGAMGQALLSGWLDGGWEAAEVAIVEPDAERAEDVARRYGVGTVALEEAGSAETIVLAVKPHQVAEVIEGLGGHLASDALVISIAAGVTLDQLSAALPTGQPAVRVMPNTPSLVGLGMSGICASSAAEPQHVERATALMAAVGEVAVVEESKFDALTAVSGSGPAYLFYLAEAMTEAGVHQGLPRELAATLVEQTLLGSATLLEHSDSSASELRERVTSPAGTTAAALRRLDDHGVRAAILDAVAAAASRSQQLSGN